MKQITLNIDESKYNAFLNFIKTLDYVSVSESMNIPLEHQLEVERRLKLIEKDTMKTKSWNDAKKDIFKR